MRKLALILALTLTSATPAAAESSDLRSLVTGDDGKGWEAVGRLNMGDNAFCTGSLIAENLVLTAGHCLYDKFTGDRIDETRIEFLAGWRAGRASAYRGIRRAIVHPEYQFSSENVSHRVRYDLAILELDRPIRSTSIRPFETMSQPRKGTDVGVVSYAHDRAESPSLQEQCKVLARQSGALVLSCTVDFGSSGSPVFVLEDGMPRIVSVVSAKAMVRDIPVSLGTSLEQPLSDMLTLLDESGGAFGQVQPSASTFSTSGGTAAGGAKFVRP